MNTERFIAKRIIFGSGDKKQLSRPIVRISVLGIALGMAVMILSVSVVTGFQKEIRNKLIGFGSHVQVTNYDSNSSDEPEPISSHQSFVPLLVDDPAIAHIQVFATKSGLVKTKTDNEGIVLKGISNDYDWTFIRQNMVSGASFEMKDTASRGIVISKYLADRLELGLDEKLRVYFLTKKADSVSTSYEQRAKVFYIKGIYETGFEDLDMKMAFVDIKQIRNINYWNDDQVGGFEIALNDWKKLMKKVRGWMISWDKDFVRKQSRSLILPYFHGWNGLM